jgi:hypothetical protein
MQVSSSVARGGTVPAVPAWAVAAGFAVAFGILYWSLGPAQRGGVWVPQAEAFVHGRLHLVEDRPWLELIHWAEGVYHMPFPPVPAILLMPIVALMGPQPWQNELSLNTAGSVVGGANVGLAYLLLRRFGASGWPLILLTIGFATTTHLWVAGMSGTHHYGQLVAVFFFLAALLTARSGRWPVLAGLLLGLGAGARPSVGLALPLLLLLYGTRPSRAHLWVLIGLAGPALLVAGFNVARFDDPFQFGRSLIRSGEDQLVTSELYYSDGLMSFTYIPRSLGWALFGGLSLEWPFVTPSLVGLSLFLTAPVIFLAVRARGWLAAAVAVTFVVVMVPALIHGAWGFAQWGYRFILDGMPLLLVLLALTYRGRPVGWLLPATVVIGAVANFAGFVWYAQRW